MKIRIFAIVLALSLLLCAAPRLTLSVSAAENDTAVLDPLRYGWQVLSQMDNADDLLYVYQELVAGIQNAEESISVRNDDHCVTVEQFPDVLEAVRSDYPEFFWLGLSYSQSALFGQVYTFKPNYTMEDEQIRAAKVALDRNTRLLLTGLEDKSDYEISKLIHDRLAAFMSYQSSENDQTIYGALVEREAVCAGYASAYQYLMQRSGIPAWKVTGSSINPATGAPEGHAWTLTCLDGNWYHTDVTWDDQGTLGNIYYAYLNVPTTQILEDHALNPFYANSLPDCSSTEHNYFVRNNTQAETFDTAQAAKVFQANHLTARFYVTGDINAFLQGFSDNIYSLIETLHLTGSIRCVYSVLGREVMLYIWDGSYTPFPVGITLNTLPDNTTWKTGMDVTGGMLTVHYDDGNTQSVAMDSSMISGFDPKVSGKQVVTVTYQGCTEYFTVEVPEVPATTPGDFTGDNTVNNDDVVLLLWHTLFPEDYPLTVSGDLTGDGAVSNDDVVLLLWHTLFPEDYPL